MIPTPSRDMEIPTSTNMARAVQARQLRPQTMCAGLAWHLLRGLIGFSPFHFFLFFFAQQTLIQAIIHTDRIGGIRMLDSDGVSDVIEVLCYSSLIVP